MPTTLRSTEALLRAGLVWAEDAAALRDIEARYAVAVPPAFLALIEGPADPIGLQVIPHPDEAAVAPHELADPIADDALSPLPGLVHRYEDRVLIKPLLICPLYCRFCFRREHVGPDGGLLTEAQLEAALDYVRARPAIREVILTGGDPLMLSARRLRALLGALDAIAHVETLRIHTRVPVAAPERVTTEVLAALETEKPLFMAVHANHAREFGPEAAVALRALSRAGGAAAGAIRAAARRERQRGGAGSVVPGHAAAPGEALLPAPARCGARARRGSMCRRPRGLALLAGLRFRVTGLAWPTYVRERPGGAGKVPLGPAAEQEAVLF